MKQGKTTIGNVCFLIDRKKNRVLLLERSREPMQGKYTGVEGKTDFEEDIHSSCIREIKEETGYDAQNLQLKGIIKTILDGFNSTWILFIYTTEDFSGEHIMCDEGELHWVKMEKLFDINLIGFIREILPYVFDEDAIIEGTIKHDAQGNVLEKKIVKVAAREEIS